MRENKETILRQCDCCGANNVELSFSIAYGIETWSCVGGCDERAFTERPDTGNKLPETRKTFPPTIETPRFTNGPWETGGRSRLSDIFELGDYEIYPPLGEAGPVAIAAGKDNAHLIAAAPELYDSIDPDTLEAIADEIGGEFKHSARATSLRGIAKRQRAALNAARGGEHD